jgi:hypothetical protein
MMNRETHKTKDVPVVDEAGEENTVIEYQEVAERRSLNGPSEWVKLGPTTLRLEDGTPVNRIDDDTFKVATDDRVLKRVR